MTLSLSLRCLIIVRAAEIWSVDYSNLGSICQLKDDVRHRIHKILPKDIHRIPPKGARSSLYPVLFPLRYTFQGFLFCDIFPLFRNPLTFEAVITNLTHRLLTTTIPTSPNKKIDVIVGLDARGFLLGPVIALRLGAAFVPVRKRGKLPGECVCVSYEKEYGPVRRIHLFSLRAAKLDCRGVGWVDHPYPPG